MSAVTDKLKRIGVCPVCDRPKLDLTAWAPGHYWIGCWNCGADGLNRAEYLRAVAAVVGCQPNQLLGPEAPALLAPWFELAERRRAAGGWGGGSSGVVRGD